jgi:hypothetical protein
VTAGSLVKVTGAAGLSMPFLRIIYSQ